MRKKLTLNDPKVVADLERLKQMKDEDIDTSDIPVLPREAWANGKPFREMFRPIKEAISLRVDADVLAWFRSGGEGYQSRINDALREHMNQKRS